MQSMPVAILACILSVGIGHVAPDGAFAQEVIEEVPFDGETISIMQMGDGQQALMLKEKELGRNWFAGFDRVTEVEGLPVALFYLGDGGNACGPATLIVWRDEDGEVQSLNHDEECSTPAPSVSDNGIYFVPYLAPGEAGFLKAWSPSRGLSTEARMTYVPQPDTGWTDLDTKEIFHPLDLFRNAAVHDAVAALTGEEFEHYASGLRVASEPRKLSSGILMASGCIPHNCGGGDSFIAIDLANEAVYLSQQDGENIRNWPELDAWPDNAREALAVYQASR